MKKKVFGVIAADVSDIEQREILTGIFEEAKKYSVKTVVLSNIYNPVESSDVLNTENRIYEQTGCSDYDGFILVSESIINPELQKLIINELEKKPDIPVAVVGTELPGFSLPWFRYINTSDEKDICDITDHLIDVHHFRNIHILTGHDYLEASHRRVDGYRKSLEKHGIGFDESSVFFGNFWMNSGAELAMRYISGELEYPEALICCNDYMAYGFMDAFMENGIDIKEKMAVAGYEYIRERRNHTPVLTTYQRNRKQLGKNAVLYLIGKTDSDNLPEPSGRIIPGESCGCGTLLSDSLREIEEEKLKKMYDFLNLFCQFEHSLTECRNLDEFAEQCRNFKFMVRGADSLHMCLYENWYAPVPGSETMIRYNLLESEETQFFRKGDYELLFGDGPDILYLSPLFFSERELGYTVLGFSSPDVYDPSFRNWMKYLSNGLEFLRMKNDIKYLTECQNLSEQRDMVTGLYNLKGIEKKYETINKENLHMVMLQIYQDDNENVKPEVLNIISDILRNTSGKSVLAARTDKNIFISLYNRDMDDSIICEVLNACISQNSELAGGYGLCSFLCTSVLCSELSFREAREKCLENIQEKNRAVSEMKISPYFRKLSAIRNFIYRNPEKTFDTEAIYSMYKGSREYVRKIYVKCFGTTIQDECIYSRILKAVYHLVFTGMDINEIAEKCGYSDSKYFMRQFSSKTGMTAVSYRKIFEKDSYR
ncbi:MAG: substrate-binding domain-containing protein [Oscillospiraceae bacterium]|nr:substrate-binding domain-containing protein [Oscillospiraceae bacterium]